MLKSKEIALIAMLSSTGGAISVPIGYLGNLLKGTPWLPFGSPQLLSGIHIIWLVLGRLLTKKFGTATLIGAVKGLVELSLFSFHGAQVLPISIVEGLTADLVLFILGSNSPLKVAIAGGLSSSNNVLVIYLLLLQSLPIVLIAFMWFFSFISGLLAGYFCIYSSKRIPIY
ncbi:MAG: ECF transporter S component [Candidatus Bathyarchaeia archaeon]